MKKIQPPKWAARFLSWYCRPELLEDLLGDLNEYFERNVATKGPRRARLIFVLDVFKFIRSYTIKRPDFIHYLIQWIMIRSYLKTSSRSIVRNKLFSVINIAGLAVSLSVGLLMISMIMDLKSYDYFQEKKDRIYRVISHDERSEQPPMDLATTSTKAGKMITETMTGVEKTTLMRNGFGGDAHIGEKFIPLSGMYADQSFFRIFTFPLLQGNPATALREPYSIVLTETAAKKLFGQTEVLGKAILFDTTHYLVTGVMKDVPKLSHFRFESLASFSTVETLQLTTTGDGELMDWSNIYMTYVYVLLPPDGDVANFQRNLDQLSTAENRAIQHRSISLSTQALTDIATGKRLSNQSGPIMNRIALWILTGLAAIVILSACFNYTNLSIARSLRRSREVGIRKVIGALRSHVLGQFITESLIIALLSLAVSFLLFLGLRLQLLSLHSFFENLFSLELSLRLVGWFVVLAIAVGLLAGVLPALFFSRINAVQVLKDASGIQVFRHVNLRKVLIVIQYVFSLMFISATTIGYQQYKGFLAYDLGFSTENILNIKLNGASGDQLIKELSELPEVTGTSRSVIITSLGSIYGETAKYNDPTDSASVWTNLVDDHYVPLHHHQLVAGRNFNPRPENSVESELLVNEKFVKRFNISGNDPNKALGEVIHFGKTQLTIVGVVKDFHYETLEDEIHPTVMRNNAPKNDGYVNARVNTQDWATTGPKIEMAWRKVDAIHPLEAKFYNDQIEEAYSQFSVMLKVIGFLSFLAISISSMGLFGMVVFTTETRMREISIRKVLGATEWKLIYLLSRGFIVLLAVASLLALPLTYLFFDKVVLAMFAYHQPIVASSLLGGLAIVLAVALLMMGSQTLKVARTNPATVLKNE